MYNGYLKHNKMKIKQDKVQKERDEGDEGEDISSIDRSLLDEYIAASAAA